jgi:hypothetical protein
VGVTGLDRQIVCRWCGTRSLVEGMRFVPEYFVRPAVDADGARRALQRLLSGRPLPKGTLRRCRFGSAELHFVPYNEVSARRTGTMVLDAAVGRGEAVAVAVAGAGAARRPDTRVIFGGIQRVSPAVRLAGWALDQVALAGGGDVEAIPEPIDRLAMARLGRVLHPEIAPEAALDTRGPRNFSSSVEDATEIAEVRVRRVWYPVWRLRYEHQGRPYFATVDGVSGAVMGARAPQGDSGRVFWLLSAAMLVAFLLGGALRTLGGALSLDAPAAGLLRLALADPLFGPLLLGTAGVALLVVCAVAWEQFRYPGEIVFRGDSFELEKIGAAAENPLMNLAAKLSEALSRGFEGGREGR